MNGHTELSYKKLSYGEKVTVIRTLLQKHRAAFTLFVMAALGTVFSVRAFYMGDRPHFLITAAFWFLGGPIIVLGGTLLRRWFKRPAA